jgi:hypothetical protein
VSVCAICGRVRFDGAGPPPRCWREHELNNSRAPAGPSTAQCYRIAYERLKTSLGRIALAAGSAAEGAGEPEFSEFTSIEAQARAALEPK